MHKKKFIPQRQQSSYRTVHKKILASKRWRLIVTGGIGVGKSYLCRTLNCFGITWIDSDKIAKSVLQNEAASRIVEEFDVGILEKVSKAREVGDDTRDDGHDALQVDSAKLRQVMLRSNKDWDRIDEIIHPMVRKKRADIVQRARRAVVVELPSVLHPALPFDSDLILVIESSVSRQYKRVMSRKGMTDELFAAIIARQGGGIANKLRLRLNSRLSGRRAVLSLLKRYTER